MAEQDSYIPPKFGSGTKKAAGALPTLIARLPAPLTSKTFRRVSMIYSYIRWPLRMG